MNQQIPLSFELETNRYQLRFPNKSDIPFVFSATRFPGFNDGMHWDPPPNEEALLLPLQSNTKAWKSGNGYAFTIIDKKTKDRVGRIAIRKTNADHVWDVGYWTHPEFQGKGVMTEALATILQFGFTKLNARSIEGTSVIWNVSSKKVMERNGFKLLRHVKNGFKKNGLTADENILSINKSDWKARKNKA